MSHIVFSDANRFHCKSENECDMLGFSWTSFCWSTGSNYDSNFFVIFAVSLLYLSIVSSWKLILTLVVSIRSVYVKYDQSILIEFNTHSLFLRLNSIRALVKLVHLPHGLACSTSLSAGWRCWLNLPKVNHLKWVEIAAQLSTHQGLHLYADAGFPATFSSFQITACAPADSKLDTNPLVYLDFHHGGNRKTTITLVIIASSDNAKHMESSDVESNRNIFAGASATTRRSSFTFAFIRAQCDITSSGGIYPAAVIHEGCVHLVVI